MKFNQTKTEKKLERNYSKKLWGFYDLQMPPFLFFRFIKIKPKLGNALQESDLTSQARKELIGHPCPPESKAAPEAG